MEYSNWIIKVHLTKGLFNKAWTGFKEIKWIQSTPTTGRNAIPKPKEARGGITGAEEGSCTGEGTCCDLQQRHVATPQQPNSKESEGKHPDFMVLPPSSPLVVPHQLNPTRSPRAKDLLVQPRQVQGVEQDRKPW